MKKLNWNQLSCLGSASAMLLALTACDSEVVITDTGTTTVVADIYSNPNQVVCNPFENNPAFPALGMKHGIVGRLGYIPADNPPGRFYRDFEERGSWVNASLFLSDMNVPTRKFDLGFINQNGDTLTDQTGDKLYENFALELETRVKLTADDAEGDYQFAILSDDGSIVEIDRGNGWEALINNDGLTPTRLQGSLERIALSHGDGLPLRVKYYQGPRHHIALILLWRPYPDSGAADPLFGRNGNGLFFNYGQVPSVPKDPYFDLLHRGWRPVPSANYQLPAHVAGNPCAQQQEPEPEIQYRVAQMCTQGEFVPKPTLKLGLSMDPGDVSAATIRSNFGAMGVAPIEYSDADVIAGKPQTDGVTVLAISRKVTVAPVSQDYVNAVRAFMSEGGSVIGEYDGAALAFTDYVPGQLIMNNVNPSFRLFDGTVAGGGALLPVESSRAYVIDADHPLMAGLPANFLNGVRQAFAVTDYDDRWLNTHAQFISTGFGDLVPAGTYPAVMSARCGQGRVVLFTMNHFQVMNQAPVSTMIHNALNWTVGQ